MNEKLYQYLLMLGDNSMILGHRLSELCGHGPTLETDIALTNISLDLFGQVRNYFQYAAKLKGDGATEDSIAFLRYERDFRCVWLVQQPNTDFAHTIVRQFLFDSYHLLLLQTLENSSDEQIAAISKKSIKEVKYHLRFSSSWIKRLGNGTNESHKKTQDAVDYLYDFTNEIFIENDIEIEMKETGIGADIPAMKEVYYNNINQVLKEATLKIPNNTFPINRGKEGIHSEHLGFILSNLQYMQRAYPNMTW